MNVANLYRKIKQILNDSNVALVNKGMSSVNSLSQIVEEIKKISINRLPYLMRTEITEIMEDDWGDVTNLQYSFLKCDNLTSVTIPNSVTRLGHSVFGQCSNLIDVTIPDSVTTIEYGVFQNCIKLPSITIPNSVTSIGNSVFFRCNSLTDIYLKPTTPPSLGNTNAIPETTTIHVPIGSGDAYKEATNWSYHSARIVEDIEND